MQKKKKSGGGRRQDKKTHNYWISHRPSLAVWVNDDEQRQSTILCHGTNDSVGENDDVEHWSTILYPQQTHRSVHNPFSELSTVSDFELWSLYRFLVLCVNNNNHHQEGGREEGGGGGGVGERGGISEFQYATQHVSLDIFVFRISRGRRRRILLFVFRLPNFTSLPNTKG